MNFMNKRSHCKECNVTFVRFSETQVYCNACLTNAYYEELFRKKTHDKNCEFCGRAFETNMSDKNYCSAVCRVELAKIKTPNQVPTSSNPYSRVDLALQNKIKKEDASFHRKQFARYLKATKWDM